VLHTLFTMEVAQQVTTHRAVEHRLRVKKEKAVAEDETREARRKHRLTG